MNLKILLIGQSFGNFFNLLFLPQFNIKNIYIVYSSDGARVALKIIKNIDRYREAAMSEVEVLEQLKSVDSERR